MQASNLTAPAAALRNLGNATRSVVGTSTEPVTTAVAANDPAMNGPLPPTSGRLLQTNAACSPVDLSSAVGNISVPAVAANLAVTLPESFYASQGAGTGSEKAALLAQLADSLTTALLSNTSDPSTIPGVVALLNAWSACTGLPPALGVLGAIVPPVVYIPPAAANTGDADTANWIVFTVTAAGTLAMGLLSYIRNVKPEARLLYRLATLLLAVTALAHLVMVLGGPGVSAVGHAGETLPVQWVRYAEWAVTAPLTIVMLGLLAGGHWSDILVAVSSAELGIAAGFAAAMSTGANATWPLFTFGLVVGGLPVLGTLGFTLRRAARARTPQGSRCGLVRLYDFLALTSLVLYAAGYVIVWSVSDGGTTVTPNQAAIAFAVLELLSKPAFAAAIVLGRESIARYGSALGCLNTGEDVDFTIPPSVYASSATAYKVEPGPLLAPQHVGEPRDVAFARLHAATGTGLSRRR